MRVFLLVTTSLCLVALGTAQAANPSSGTLSRRSKKVQWSGTFTLSEPDPLFGCVGGSSDPICDHYTLKADLPDGARIRIELPVPDATTDLDMYVYNAAGSEVARGASGFGGANEAAEFRHSGRFRNKPYEVRIVPFTVAPGTTYKATARVK
jgi:hypothetical protein